jgi:hypothetical protein
MRQWHLWWSTWTQRIAKRENQAREGRATAFGAVTASAASGEVIRDIATARIGTGLGRWTSSQDQSSRSSASGLHRQLPPGHDRRLVRIAGPV